MSRLEEYEMIDNPSMTSIESQPPHILDSDSDTDSVTSVIFDNINASTNESHDFNDDETFQSVLLNYKTPHARSKLCMIISGICFIIWLVLLIVYANINVSSIVKTPESVIFDQGNFTLNPYSPTNHNLTMDSMRRGDVLPTFSYIRWLNRRQYPDTGTGYYMTMGPQGSWVIADELGLTMPFIPSQQFGYNNNFFYVHDVILNPGKPVNGRDTYHIITTDKSPVWRHLSHAIYWLYKPLTSEYIPIQPEIEKDELFKLSFAVFSPSGLNMVYNYDGNLYCMNLIDMTTTSMTNNGSLELFNGKCDWIYEEEILSTDKMVWWSPDSKNVVYATLNETGVMDYELQYYSNDDTEFGDDSQYPSTITYKYPKPGQKLPRILLFNYNLETNKTTALHSDYPGEDILYDLTWLNDDTIMTKATDKFSSIQYKVMYTISTAKSTLVKKTFAAEFGGWYDLYSSMVPLKGGYLDKVVEKNRTHLGFFDSPTSDTPRMLTSSENWDVLDDAPVIYNEAEDLIYTLANIKGPLDAHVIGIKFDTGKIEMTLGESTKGKFLFQSDDGGQFLALEYSGPSLPWQKIINTGNLHVHDDIDEFIQNSHLLSSDKELEQMVQSYNLPSKNYVTVNINGVDIDLMVIYPPNFNENRRKYPVLVTTYGGPGSKSVTYDYTVGFEEVVSSQLDAIVLKVDPRGTDGRGWTYKHYALFKLGYWEPRDITSVVSKFIEKNSKWIDKDAVAMWGWSYGGFTTLKVLEYDKGNTFKYGMAVAPVTNFLLYNAYYTTRYMKGLENRNYSETSVVKDIDAFNSVNRFLIMHGTADDNVHIQNLYWLLDKFNVQGLENYDIHFFTDNNHNIDFHGSGTIVYDKLFRWLRDAFIGKFK